MSWDLESFDSAPISRPRGYGVVRYGEQLGERDHTLTIPRGLEPAVVCIDDQAVGRETGPAVKDRPSSTIPPNSDVIPAATEVWFGFSSRPVDMTANPGRHLSEAFSIWPMSSCFVGGVPWVTKKAVTALATTRRCLSDKSPSEAQR
jgi:hypothetical protein